MSKFKKINNINDLLELYDVPGREDKKSFREFILFLIDNEMMMHPMGCDIVSKCSKCFHEYFIRVTRPFWVNHLADKISDQMYPLLIQTLNHRLYLQKQSIEYEKRQEEDCKRREKIWEEAGCQIIKPEGQDND